MIYLDGSRFFFDIEGCFSKSVEQAREQSKDLEHDKDAKELCKGFGEFFDIKPDFIRAGKDYSTVFRGIFAKGPKAVIPEHEISMERYEAAFAGFDAVRVKKAPDMKLRAQALIDAANESEAEAIFISNPCCPTALEMNPEDILKVCDGVKATVVVDESCCVDENTSVIGYIPEKENLVVLKKVRFGGDAVFACGKNLPEFDCEINSSDQAAGCVIFEHDSALKTAQRKLMDSRDSLYIRIKKLAIKYDALERLYRTKANCVFFKVKDAEERAKKLFDMGISVLCKDGYFCIFAGEKDENEAVLKALEEIFK